VSFHVSYLAKKLKIATNSAAMTLPFKLRAYTFEASWDSIKQTGIPQYIATLSRIKIT